MVIPNGCGVSFRTDENVLKLTVVRVVYICEYAKIHPIIYFMGELCSKRMLS